MSTDSLDPGSADAGVPRDDSNKRILRNPKPEELHPTILRTIVAFWSLPWVHELGNRITHEVEEYRDGAQRFLVLIDGGVAATLEFYHGLWWCWYNLSVATPMEGKLLMFLFKQAASHQRERSTNSSEPSAESSERL